MLRRTRCCLLIERRQWLSFQTLKTLLHVYYVLGNRLNATSPTRTRGIDLLGPGDRKGSCNGLFCSQAVHLLARSQLFRLRQELERTQIAPMQTSLHRRTWERSGSRCQLWLVAFRCADRCMSTTDFIESKPNHPHVAESLMTAALKDGVPGDLHPSVRQ
jgi:hypothetical protein